MNTHSTLKLIGLQRGFSLSSLSTLCLLLLGCAIAAAATNATSTLRPIAVGDLEMVFRSTAQGIQLEQIRDRRFQALLATHTTSFYSVVLRHGSSKKDRTLSASEGWQRAELSQRSTSLELHWADPVDETLTGLAIHATGKLDERQSAIRWSLRVDNQTKDWSVRRVIFPQIDLADLGTAGVVLFPRGPGELQPGVWQRDFHYRGNYPDGWCAMQFMAAYRPGEQATGLYVGQHDPWGSTKHLELKSSPGTHTVRMAFDTPATDLDQAGNDFVLSGEAVWQLLRGDWYDAALIYRPWARQEARWWPKLSSQGRTDTPLWMRELSAWVMTGGAPGDCVPRVKRFQEALGLPIGFHWYNWHQIPFDNDYPHYFPTKINFAQGVAELQDASVHVMPYINGRLWDTKDQGAEDFEFSRIALPAATKQENGEPYSESYGSKETNGQPVRLAVMCPTTRLWQEKVRDIVLRLQRAEGTHGVYIDQIAAAAPTLCMEAKHGHPLGGGHWWTEGYWALLEGIRREMPSDRMITTECNGEPFIRWFDGYLTWHWQHEGQVPVFPAVYGGTIQMFGRAYRGGPTKELALRMKAGQQLVFGEQIGWFDPGQASETNNYPFLRKVIQTRWNFRRYFYAGEMARPPRLQGETPKVKADWQWSGEWPVTTEAVLTGGWHIPAEKRWLLLFVNVSDQAVKASLRYALPREDSNLVKMRLAISRDGETAGESIRSAFPPDEEIEFSPQSVQAWELISTP